MENLVGGNTRLTLSLLIHHNLGVRKHYSPISNKKAQYQRVSLNKPVIIRARIKTYELFSFQNWGSPLSCHVAFNLFSVHSFIQPFVLSTRHKHFVCVRLSCTQVNAFQRDRMRSPLVGFAQVHIFHPQSLPLPLSIPFPMFSFSHLWMGKKGSPIALLILLVTEPSFLGSEGLALPTQCTMYQR